MLYKTRIIIECFTECEEFVIENEVNDYIDHIKTGDTIQAMFKVFKKGYTNTPEFVNCMGKVIGTNNAIAKDGYSDENELIKVISVRPYQKFIKAIKDTFDKINKIITENGNKSGK